MTALIVIALVGVFLGLSLFDGVDSRKLDLRGHHRSNI